MSSTPSERKIANRGTHRAASGIVRHTSVKPTATACARPRRRVIANPAIEAQTTVSGTAIATTVSELSSCRHSGTRSAARSKAASDGDSGTSSSPTGGGRPGSWSAEHHHGERHREQCGDERGGECPQRPTFQALRPNVPAYSVSDGACRRRSSTGASGRPSPVAFQFFLPFLSV